MEPGPVQLSLVCHFCRRLGHQLVHPFVAQVKRSYDVIVEDLDPAWRHRADGQFFAARGADLANGHGHQAGADLACHLGAHRHATSR